MSNKLTFRHSKTIQFFQLKPVMGTWQEAGKCPFCQTEGKFGIKLNDVAKSNYKNHISFNCFKGSCQQKGSEYKLFDKIGQGHLLKQGEFIGNKKEVDSAKIKEFGERELELEVPTLKPPLGFRRCSENQYLQDRGFESWQFETYHIGTTKFYSPLKDRVIFLVMEDGENKGFVARTTWSKKEIEQYERKHGHFPKYVNEKGADFAKLLFGIDEITEETEQVILVEGVTDKANVDRQLKLNLSPKIKCCCTFGKKISEEQVMKLWKRGVSSVILLYDPDAINSAKKYSYFLRSWNIAVKVGYLSDKDPGELSHDEIVKVLADTQSPDEFSVNRVQKRKLI